MFGGNGSFRTRGRAFLIVEIVAWVVFATAIGMFIVDYFVH